ncbi:MAG: hypothetical protein KBT01_01170 [Clostridiales bacterium]|nr:hypothetical protein [Candidatus Blautia equi]
MEEFYALIEEKIKNSGYPGHIDGREFYDEVNDEIDDKDNGTYIYMINKSETVFYQGVIEIMDDDIDLRTLDIHVGEKVYHVDFDA